MTRHKTHHKEEINFCQLAVHKIRYQFKEGEIAYIAPLYVNANWSTGLVICKDCATKLYPHDWEHFKEVKVNRTPEPKEIKQQGPGEDVLANLEDEIAADNEL